MIRKFEEQYSPDSPYFRLGRGEGSVFRNRSLSLKATGLYCLIWSLPEKWDFSAAGLSLIVRETPASIRKGLKELEDAGYIPFIRNREGGKFSGDDCLIFSSPCFDFPNAVKPNAVKPNSVNRQQEIKNKEIKNKEIKKEEDPPAEGKLFPGERIRF